jgi:hypothetical protein
MKMTTENPVTQKELDIYNSYLPKHLQAELWEMERVTGMLYTYPIAERKVRTIIRDRNYEKKYSKVPASTPKTLDDYLIHSSDTFRRIRAENAYLSFEDTKNPPREQKFDENGYRITSPQEREAFLNQFISPVTPKPNDADSQFNEDTDWQLTESQKEGLRPETYQLLGKIFPRAKIIYKELQGSPETPFDNVPHPLGPFSGYSVKSKIEGNALTISYFGKEQIDAGLTEEASITLIKERLERLILKCPTKDSKTYNAIAKYQWPDNSGIDSSTIIKFWDDFSNDLSLVPRELLIELHADSLARLKLWNRVNPYSTLFWHRN